jgi:hypothetical protein
LRGASRQNSVLIEHAWSLDAATLRLLAQAGSQALAGSPAAAYTPAPTSGWLERKA